MKLSRFLMILLIGLSLVPTTTAFAEIRNIYPSWTPWTAGQNNPNTEFTIDINPKYTVIKNEPISFDVYIRIDVLSDNKVNRITLDVYIPEGLDDDFTDGMVYVYDSKDNPVTPMIWTRYDGSEGLSGGPHYTGFIETDGYYEKSEYFYVNFKLYLDYFYGIDLLTVYYAAKGDMRAESIERIFVWIRQGDEYDTTPPEFPTFKVPELPLGTLTALATMASVVLLKRRK